MNCTVATTEADALLLLIVVCHGGSLRVRGRAARVAGAPSRALRTLGHQDAPLQCRVFLHGQQLPCVYFRRMCLFRAYCIARH